jgi:hypothetical protein
MASVKLQKKGTGNRKRVLSDFTFLHIPLNFSVHLLRSRIWQRDILVTPGSLIFFGVREIAKKIENPGVVMVLAISRNLA